MNNRTFRLNTASAVDFEFEMTKITYYSKLCLNTASAVDFEFKDMTYKVNGESSQYRFRGRL